MQIGGIGGSTAAFSAQEQRRVTEQSSGASLRDAAAMVAAATGLPRKQVYARALALPAED